MVFISSVCLVVSVTGLAFFFSYPLFLLLASRLSGRDLPRSPLQFPRISLVIAVRNGENLIREKIQNCLDLDWPSDRLDVEIYSDGSTDATEARAAGFGPAVRVTAAQEHRGKIHALNTLVPRCRGEFLVFTDADALLAPDALKHLMTPFSHPDVGGVCGQRIIAGDTASFHSAQTGYIRFDSSVKARESRIGSITSNDGKLFAIKKELFQPVPEAVTDDFFIGLSVVAQKKRFVFAPGAFARIAIPSKDPLHELVRRRRIVTGSLRALFFHRTLFNPFKHGIFSVCLFINKGIRRLMPIFLFGLLISSLLLFHFHALFSAAFLLQIAGYGAALTHPLLSKRNHVPATLKRISSMGFYFLVGNLGTLLALFDSLLGRKVKKWDPVKEVTR